MDIKKLNRKVNKNIIMSIIVFAVAISAMIISYINISNIGHIEDSITLQAKIYTALVYGLVAFLQIVNYIKEYKKPGSLNYLVSCFGCLGCCALIIIFNNMIWAYPTSAIVFFVTAIVSRIVSMIGNRTARNIIFNILLIVIISFLLVASIAYTKDENKFSPTTIVCYFIVVITLAYILKEAFYRIRLNSIKDILKRTYALEILLGLLALIVSFSFLLTLFEEIDFKDALWYCFAVVTTIGFGDVTVSTIIGRILSVVLGIYGIIVVAVITSVIVNFYNESKNFEKVQKDKK